MRSSIAAPTGSPTGSCSNRLTAQPRLFFVPPRAYALEPLGADGESSPQRKIEDIAGTTLRVFGLFNPLGPTCYWGGALVPSLHSRWLSSSVPVVRTLPC